MPRVYIGLTEGDKEVWKASNVATEGNILVTVELSFAGQDAKPLDRYKAALLELDKEATKRRQLAKYSWIFALETPLTDVFQTLVNPACSHCVDEARRKAGELRDDDRVLCWVRGKYVHP